MRYRPISFERLAAELTERILALPGTPWVRVAIDGVAGTSELADLLVDPLRVNGRAALRVSTVDFLRPASLRFEKGKQDPDARYLDWLDEGALRREVLDPLSAGGDGMVLPALWDAGRDRATRLDRVELPAGGVLIADGELLLGRGLPVELTVHLSMSANAVRRRLPQEEHWALPAFARYEEEVHPAEVADVVVRVEDPRHPAVAA
ncbi:uridine kinase [Amycolatopsis acidiphila]|uniref:Uridine kinase n=1 Tax=Amycolatopsis acidiphila TaxID=715473 RepID=A0A558A1T5_9PSEU|nr:uridine kinase [Amycolatopsis acidiphila]TVT18220.1 uridine kinase [Amycolatopsis acidiphila]UIJ58439.1 uridine kinase [Amycolatopsis acidiphila]GHG93278.1 uridine kinase [Amycolatopsis acidiphila]